MIDILGHIFYIFLIAGTFLASRGNRRGWGIRALGSAGWCGIGVATELSSIWFWSAVFLTIDISAWVRPRKRDTLTTTKEIAP